METSLPDLPFVNYGKAELVPFGSHSSVKLSPRTYPRTDLETFTPWTSFLSDVDQAIQSAASLANLPHTPFAIQETEDEIVDCEEAIRAHASGTLHTPVVQVLRKLGVMGRFAIAGGGSRRTIGSPDYSWITSSTQPQPHPKLVVEYKTWWAADLVNLPAVRKRRLHSTLSRQSLDALEQVYGYMTFNNNKFGILTNWQRSWFLRRAETSQRKTLEYYPVELDGPNPPISMLKAWVGMVLLANNDWFYASPTLSENFGDTETALKEQERAFARAGKYQFRPVNGEYPCLPLDIHLCHFDSSTGGGGTGASGRVVPAQFLRPSQREFHVVCKVVDVMRYPEAGDFLHDEACAYATLESLQGQVIPRFHGFYVMWGILKLLALEPVGDAIPEGENIDQRLREKMRAALRRIHNAGFVHGDIARRNFCRTESGKVFLVDLERCQSVENQSELDDEMDQVDEL